VGLGLALSAGLVQAMGGELTVGRTGPEGTEMRVRLPRPDHHT
jgi:signal transduction histidine kinase